MLIQLDKVCFSLRDSEHGVLSAPLVSTPLLRFVLRLIGIQRAIHSLKNR